MLPSTSCTSYTLSVLIAGPFDHGSGDDVEPGAVALAHDRPAYEQASGERARLVSTGAKVVERVEAAVDTRDRDP